ncbi:DUF6779 domain-containing protein [Nocardia sp. NBC_00416]|uniref:DUF6779 domain-containing protein n=1 Tax=Nocardia sp. NBC_00416 TaxID=2975991 RepID=UPI002E201D73
MVSPSRSSTSARGREDVGKLFLGALVLLGLVASVFLVLSDSLQFIRVGLVVALWAAVLGAWAVSRYQAKVRDLRRIYELELEREISARREHEFGVESRVRAELGADATEMAALRAELAILRRHLERLFDGELPEERPALRASAFRVQELPSAEDKPSVAADWPSSDEGERGAVDAWANAAASWSHAADGWADAEAEAADPGPDSRERDTATPVYETDYPGRPRFASPDDAPVTAETAIVRLDDDPPQGPPAPDISGPTWADAFTEVHDDAAGATYGPPRPEELIYGPPAPEFVAQAAVAETAVAETAETAVAEKPREHAWRGSTDLSARPANSRRRRTQADSGGSRRLSVAEIMANLRQEEEQRSS